MTEPLNPNRLYIQNLTETDIFEPILIFIPATFLIGLFCLTSSVVLSETVKLSDLVVTNGLYYTKLSDVPFTGKLTGPEQG